ncbi:MAG TPA: efflux RND transporter permease subunit, partial [Burkholderiales bacterium]|nr:efflux RND transporter permease subunit [Burkholderiales bacterium]
KNAILIVEFAEQLQDDGLSTIDAAIEAARIRLRPILMTSLAFILGVMPLAFSTGAGAGARIAVGTGVMGGMLAATFLAIFFVPMFFKLLTDRHLVEKRSTPEIRAEIEHHKHLQEQATQAAHRTQAAKEDGNV